MKINIDRIREAMKNIEVSGKIGHNCHPSETRNDGPMGRLKMFEEAITSILEDGEKSMQGQYFGMKNYSGFGDQRCDCQYGMGPTHGSIVFSIGRTSEARQNHRKLGLDEIYLLECVRDFGDLRDPNAGSNERWPDTFNLLQVISRFDEHRKQSNIYEGHLESATVDAHEVATP